MLRDPAFKYHSRTDALRQSIEAGCSICIALANKLRQNINLKNNQDISIKGFLSKVEELKSDSSSIYQLDFIVENRWTHTFKLKLKKPRDVVGGSGDEFDPDSALKDNFGTADPFQYVDPNQANENIKALLEGAFDDDGGAEGGAGRRRLPRRAQKVAETTEKKPEETKAEDESEYDVVDGLKVRLLPHQVEGVAWMIEKESGKKKRNGVLPKGGILADDVSYLIPI